MKGNIKSLNDTQTKVKQESKTQTGAVIGDFCF